jgi:hypothetical protein
VRDGQFVVQIAGTIPELVNPQIKGGSHNFSGLFDADNSHRPIFIQHHFSSKEIKNE